MAKRYGIDLGTTYSTISWYDDSRQEVKPLPLESEDGETTSLRSVVYYPTEGSPVVGEVAWNTRKQDPGRVIVGIKRKMGDEYQTDAIDGRRRTPLEVSADRNFAQIVKPSGVRSRQPVTMLSLGTR